MNARLYTPEMNRARWFVLCELCRMTARELWRNLGLRLRLAWMRWCILPWMLLTMTIQVCIGAVRGWCLLSILAAVRLWADFRAWIKGW